MLLQSVPLPPLSLLTHSLSINHSITRTRTRLTKQFYQTRTSAADLASNHRIYMTAVDTGWINDENPREKAARIAKEHHFQTPIDEVDAAARVLHPVFEGVSTGKPLFGVFLKDYVETEW